jgi:curved DNA-binding protein CbpA
MKAADPWTEDLRRLGLSPRATWSQVEARYRRLALRLHPDVNPARPAAERFSRIAAAYQRLSALRGEHGADTREDLLRLRKDARVRSLPPQELALRLRHSSSARVRAASALLLGSAGGREARGALRAALRDLDTGVREAALEALGAAGRPADLPALLGAVLRGCAPLPALRCAANVLGRILGGRRK